MQIGYIVIYVKDVETSKNFWINKCDFKLLDTIEMGEHKIYHVGNDENSTMIELVPLIMMEGAPMNTGCPSILFNVENLEYEYKKLQSFGVKVMKIEELPIGKVFTFFDSEDNAFAVMQKKNR